ncbi:major facilitator superfamily MFS_1 [Ktedonobacter racemifer DSM 44963]|uniref:Major facilitator superfamily MFS_1 n=2 Tax=Ktedonobacter racemifer TaxID=363277 RepID=D6TTZ1_KTERA|nr:major facilitator superfamily MFS_1 [Ktedonobacter racemifer DSM 44963]
MALWRNRDFMLLWSGQAFSSLGTTVTQTAYPLLVWDLSHSAALVGLVGGLGTLPYIFLSLIVGALIDRWDRKRLMIVCDTGRAINLASVLVVMWLGRLTVAQICANTLIEGTFYVFFNLAEVSCLPQVVSKEQIPLATSQNEATTGTTVLVGPALGGALYTLSQFVPFLADAISYVISVITLSFIRVPFQGKRQEGQQRKLLAEIHEGLAWLWHQPLIRYIAFLTGGCNFIGAGLLPVLLVLVKQQHGSSLAYGTILTIGGVGAIIGSLLGAPIQKRYRFGPVIICLIWFEALCFPLYAIAPNPLLLGVISACLFVAGPIYNVVQFSYRISLIPDELQGRVNSVFRLLAFGFQPFGFALTGLLIQWFQVVPAILFLSACALLLAILTSVNKHVIHAGRA